MSDFRMIEGDVPIRVAVNGKGPLVLFVHGFPESWYSWRHQLGPVAAAGFTAAAIDVRGYGGSGKPHDVTGYDMASISCDVVRVAAALQPDAPAIIVGHDWGAPFVWNTALSRPDAIRAVAELLPDLPQVACFDTAFHRSQPAVAQLFALPRAITQQGVRRYGFHGLSYEYIAQVLPEHLDAGRANGRVIVAHLGNGDSMCAMRERKSVASTMGFTAIEGLMMGTRTGSLDPGVLLYLLDHQQLDVKALTRLLYKESGLLGVSGISSDMRVLLASDRAEAREAVELFCYRITREIGSLAAALGGIDALVFTGGIGEHAAPVRHAVCMAAQWLGIEFDPQANSDNAICISMPTSKVSVLVLPTNEEWMIARHTAALIQ